MWRSSHHLSSFSPGLLSALTLVLWHTRIFIYFQSQASGNSCVPSVVILCPPSCWRPFLLPQPPGLGTRHTSFVRPGPPAGCSFPRQTSVSLSSLSLFPCSLGASSPTLALLPLPSMPYAFPEGPLVTSAEGPPAGCPCLLLSSEFQLYTARCPPGPTELVPPVPQGLRWSPETAALSLGRTCLFCSPRPLLSLGLQLLTWRGTQPSLNTGLRPLSSFSIVEPQRSFQEAH